MATATITPGVIVSDPTGEAPMACRQKFCAPWSPSVGSNRVRKDRIEERVSSDRDSSR